MRGLRRRIEAIIEDVNHEIRVDLGLEEVNPEVETVDTLDVSDVQKTLECEAEESEEAKAFGKVLDEICASFDEERVAEDEPETKPEDEAITEREDEPDEAEKSSAEVLEEILNSL